MDYKLAIEWQFFTYNKLPERISRNPNMVVNSSKKNVALLLLGWGFESPLRMISIEILLAPALLWTALWGDRREFAE